MKSKLLSVGVIVASFSVLTACHTVEGTVQGAGQDIHSVTNAMPTQEHHNQEVRHHNMETKHHAQGTKHHAQETKHHKNMKKKHSSVKKTTTSEKNTSSQSTTNDTNTSY